VTTFCEKVGDGFRLIAMLTKAILLLGNLMQVGTYAAFAKTEPGYGDLSMP